MPSLNLEWTDQANAGLGCLLQDPPLLDFAECGLTAFLRARSRGLPVKALPVLIRCAFRHSFIFVHSGSGIESPKDLEGKRVGTRYGMTANLWARGHLKDEFGVRLEKIHWLNTESPNTPYTLPEGMILESIPEDTDLQGWLVAGKLDALIHPDVVPSTFLDHREVKRLFPNAAEEERKSYLRTKVIPVMNVIACRDEEVDNRPEVVRGVFDAFCRAKAMGLQILNDNRQSGLLWCWEAWEKQLALVGYDPVPYSVEKTRPTLELLMRYAVEQGLIPLPISLEDLFVKGLGD
ncbi:MAG: ABC transporter substrate-binding protein [Nitrospirales bacterium]